MKRPTGAHAIRFMILALYIWIAAGAAGAQQFVGAKAGIVLYARGDVSLDARPVQLSKNNYLQMQPSQSLSTELGLVELLLSPEVYLRMGIYGLLRIERNRLDDTRLVLEKGSALIEIVQEIKGTRTRIRLSEGDVEITKKGLYRFDAGSGEVRVYGGSALVSRANSKTTIKRGRMVALGVGLGATKFDGKKADSLHQWAARRSFELFQAMSNPRMQNHWQKLSLGWVVNSSYRVRFFSERLLREWKLNRHVPLDMKIAMELEQEKIQAARESMEQKAIRDQRELEAARNPGVRPQY